MKNEQNESKKMLVSLLIGSIVGAGALYCIKSAQNRPTPVLKKIGKTISEVGDMIENSQLAGNSSLLNAIEEKLPSSTDVLNSLTDWADIGLTLWKKIRKG